MPPKAKFTREEIITAALEIARADGLNGVTARAVGVKLNSSARPIFTIFKSMDEVQKEVVTAAKELYNQYTLQGLTEELAFKGVGTQYIRFATDEPKLFQMLFMSEQRSIPDLTRVLALIDDNYKNILLSIQAKYDFDEKDAERLYRHLWIYTHGIAALCATRVCAFSEKELDDMLIEVFGSLLKRVKGEKDNDSDR